MAGSQDAFVGRAEELGQLSAALDDVLAGRGRVVVLTGEPGIGKTRLANELGTLARRRAALVAWGDCPEERGAPAYWPWSQAFSQIRNTTEAGPAVVPAGWPFDLPGLQADGAGVAPLAVQAQDADAARFRLFQTANESLTRTARVRPLVVVLENLHWADHASLTLLEVVARTAAKERLLVLATYRDTELPTGHPLSRTLGDIARRDGFLRIRLRGLPADAVAEMAQAITGRAAPAQLAQLVHSQTDGNPLFAREMLRHLADEGLLGPRRAARLDKAGFSLPVGVKEVVERRVAGLSLLCRQTLSVAAVIGLHFSTPVLEAVATPLEPVDVLAGIEEAERAGLVNRMPGGGEWSFSHSLVQRTLAEAVPAVERARLHEKVARALERLYQGRLEHHAAEIAHHYMEGLPVAADTGPAVSYSMLAGEQARRAYAFADAAGHYRQIVSIYDGPGSPDGPAAELTLARALHGQAECLAAETRPTGEAMAAMQRAFDIYVRHGDNASAVAVATLPYPGIAGGMPEEFWRRVERLAPRGSVSHGRALTRLADAARDPEEAETYRQQAVAIARAQKHDGLEAWALGRTSHLFMGLRDRELVALLRQSAAVAARAGATDAQVHAHFHLCMAHTDAGDAAAAQTEAQTCLAVAEGTHDPFRIMMGLTALARVALARGEFDRALEIAEHELDIAPHNTTGSHATSAQALLELGRADEAVGPLGVLLDSLTGSPIGRFEQHRRWVHLRLLLFLERAAGRVLLPESGYREALTQLPGEPHLTAVNAALAGALGIAAYERGDAAAAAVARPVLMGAPQFLTNRYGFVPVSIPAGTARGRIAALLGDRDAARREYEAALGFLRLAGYGPELAWACHDFASLLLSGGGRSDTADSALARGLLGEGLTVARKLGMVSVTVRMEALEGRLDRLGSSKPTYPDGLTGREVEVLRLVAAGKSNREIGEALVISENTVIRHVANIFTKTGSANRAAAAAYAAQRGISPGPI
jgi:predicted ATPase/DNA-binding CsgD family transcriptional regulator